MNTLSRLSAAACVAAFAEVMLGSWTRIVGAGMTCPDWPHCNGVWIPAMAHGTVWEWTHRLCALVLCALVISILVVARRSRRDAYAAAALNTACGLFVLQIVLGAATVRLANTPLSVAWHWGTAMAFIAALVALAVFAHSSETRVVRDAANRHAATLFAVIVATTLAAFATMCVGAYVSSSGAGLACLTLPGCTGNIVVYNAGQYVQMLHRFLAAATLLGSTAAFALAYAWRAHPSVRNAAAIGLTLVFVQIVLGLLNVSLRLPLELREAHAANAALTFLAFVGAAALAVPDAAPETERVRV